jgi:2-polyprenyl-6-methoxyphenol hydroxylase-like FAD-dependent oxidoreductase
LGFGDVVTLSKCLEDSVQKGSEIGAKLYLEKYESTRQAEAFVKSIGIDTLNRLYTDFEYPIRTPLVALRSIGLTLSNRISPLKTFFKEQAMK